MVVADDHRLMREGTAALLAADPRITIAGLARDGREAVDVVLRTRPMVALLDLNMPELRGTEVCAVLRAEAPGTRILILTVSEQEEDLYAAIRVGADGYLLKDMPPDDLIAAVLEVGRGEPRIAPRMAARMLRDLQGHSDEQGPPTAPPRGRPSIHPPIAPDDGSGPDNRPPRPPRAAMRRRQELDRELREGLTEREQEVLTLLAAGLRNREIADRLFVSETTVKTHVRHILEKLRFRNRAEAAAYAARREP